MNPNLKHLIAGIQEGENNDWAPLPESGIVPMEYDINMLAQQINARLQTLPNEVDGYEGIDYINVIFANTDFQVKAQAFISAIKSVPLVKDVAYVASAWLDKKSGTYQFVFAIQSAFGDLMFGLSVDSQNKTIAGEVKQAA